MILLKLLLYVTAKDNKGCPAWELSLSLQYQWEKNTEMQRFGITVFTKSVCNKDLQLSKKKKKKPSEKEEKNPCKDLTKINSRNRKIY